MTFQFINLCALVSTMILAVNLQEFARVVAYPHNLHTDEMIEAASISESYENELEKAQQSILLNKVIDTLELLDMPRPHMTGESNIEYLDKPLPLMNKKKAAGYCGLKLCKFTG